MESILRESFGPKPWYPEIPDYPYKPIRYLIPTRKHLTTIIALDCKGGMIMSADTQETGRFKETTLKITELSENTLLGCAGSSAYLQMLTDYMQRKIPKLGTIDLRSLNEIADEYSTQLENRIKIAITAKVYSPEDFLVSGLLATRDSGNIRKFLCEALIPPSWIELKDSPRVAIGTGGDIATVLLKTAEQYMNSFDLKWNQFTPSLLAHFCKMLQIRISGIDPYSSGFSVFNLDSMTGAVEIPTKEMNDTFVSLLEEFEKETPPEKVSEILERTKLLKFITDHISRSLTSKT